MFPTRVFVGCALYVRWQMALREKNALWCLGTALLAPRRSLVREEIGKRMDNTFKRSPFRSSLPETWLEADVNEVHTLAESNLCTKLRDKSKYFLFSFRFRALWHLEVPRLGVKSKQQLLAYATDTAMPDLSHICDLCCNLQQCQLLDPLSKARDQTCILMDPMSGS